MENEFLFILIPLFTDELDGFKVLSLRLVRPMDGNKDWGG